jgi:hypothetical protein
MRAMAPSADDAMARWWGQRARAAATPSTVRSLLAMNSLIDVRKALSSVQMPTLVMHRQGDQNSRSEEGRYLAEHIPGARFVELPGADHFVAIDSNQILDQVERFLADLGTVPAPQRVLGAVLAVAGPGVLAGSLATGRAAHTPDGRTVFGYDGPAAAIRAALSVIGGSQGQERGSAYRSPKCRAAGRSSMVRVSKPLWASPNGRCRASCSCRRSSATSLPAPACLSNPPATMPTGSPCRRLSRPSSTKVRRLSPPPSPAHRWSACRRRPTACATGRPGPRAAPGRRRRGFRS